MTSELELTCFRALQCLVVLAAHSLLVRAEKEFHTVDSDSVDRAGLMGCAHPLGNTIAC